MDFISSTAKRDFPATLSLILFLTSVVLFVFSFIPSCSCACHSYTLRGTVVTFAWCPSLLFLFQRGSTTLVPSPHFCVFISDFVSSFCRTAGCAVTVAPTRREADPVRAGTSTTRCATRATSSATRVCRARCVARPTGTSPRRRWSSASTAKSKCGVSPKIHYTESLKESKTMNV